MEEEGMITSPNSFWSLIDQLRYRFNYGDTPSADFAYANENARIRDLPFRVNSGPIEAALAEARQAEQPLCVYIYCSENPDCVRMESLFHIDRIAEEIRGNYVFMAMSATTSDGYSTLVSVKFKKLPVILLVRPTGETIPESTIFLTSEGPVSESVLLRYLQLVHPSEERATIADQNAAFEAAVIEDEARRQSEEVETEASESVNDELNDEREFNTLPDVCENGCAIKFHFPDNSVQIRVFPREEDVKLLFVFARHFLRSKKFSLYAGYPLKQIERNGDQIGNVAQGGQVLVYVVYDDESA
jgi:hypothetical protein